VADAIRPQGHGIPIRGLDLAPKSPMFNGRFGRIFRAVPPADFGLNDTDSKAALTNLGTAMVADEDPAKDGPDAEESGIPAAYTYLGQFIDHDLTFDPASSLQRQNDPDALVDFRTPRFDLDNVYGRGPDDQPYLYADGRRFLLGEALTGSALGKALTANDLPRSRAKVVDPNGLARAIIGDPRNDENVIVSQLQGLMLRLHNKLANDHPELLFQEVQQEVRFHYQWVVLNDFLPTIVSQDVLHEVLPHLANQSNLQQHKPRLEFYEPRDNPFMPLEFSAAAYRFGHSMVRPGYRLNDDTGPFPIFPFADNPSGPALTGFDQFPDTWAIDWARFLDLEARPFGDENDSANPGNPQRTQLAYRIDTSLVNPLGSLPARVASDPPPSLAGRNLLRGWRMRLPTGQDVARAMGVPVLPDSEIIIGKFTGDAGDIKGDIVTVAGDAFKGKCPLWTYVLAETEEVVITFKTTEGDKPIKSRRLGPVGGRIVAETIVGILANDSSSFLNINPLWTPSLAVNGVFGLRELIDAALKG
jgi:Animal haem peroxidase